MIDLKKTTQEDLETLFIFQTDPDGIWMAAFTSENPADKEAYIKKWIDKEFWGKGIATEGLKKFIETAVKRPLYARVAFDNFASQRVLEKCGFINIGLEKGFANARKEEIEEFVYKFI